MLRHRRLVISRPPCAVLLLACAVISIARLNVPQTTADAIGTLDTSNACENNDCMREVRYINDRLVLHIHGILDDRISHAV